MPANIARKADGSAAFAHSIVKPGDRSAWWDGEGKYNVAGAMTPAAALKKAGSFHVGKVPVYVRVGGKFVAAEDYMATVREDTKAILGIVGNAYPIQQNSEVMDLAYAIIGEGAGTRKKPRVIDLGALGNGARWFTTISLEAFELSVNRDPSRHEANLIIQWGHDGLTAVRGSLWDRRVVCENTSRAADAYGDSNGCIVRLTHAGDMTAKVAEARRVLGFVEREVKAHTAVMNALVECAIPGKPNVEKWLRTFGDILIPIPTEMERSKGREEARDAILSLCKYSPTLAGVPMSAYRVYSAVTEYADHFRPVRTADASKVGEKRASLALGGAADDVKSRAMDILRRAFLADGATGELVPVLARKATSN